MLKTIVMWLVTKFLTGRDLLQYAAKTHFVKSPDDFIQALFEQAQLTGLNVSTYDLLAAKRMLRTNELASAHYVLALLTIKANLVHCGSDECGYESIKTFFTKANTLKQHSNALKVRKDLTTLVSNNVIVNREDDVASIVSALMTNHINDITIVEFLKQAEV